MYQKTLTGVWLTGRLIYQYQKFKFAFNFRRHFIIKSIVCLLNLKKLSLKASFMLSLAMNVTSYSLGMIISFILSPLFF